MSKIVGLSLSFCISDILRGNVLRDDVEFLVTSTCATCKADWDKLIEIYINEYTQWRKNPELARELCNHFYSNARVFQPRAANMPTVSEQRKILDLDNKYGEEDHLSYYPWIPLEAWDKYYQHAYRGLVYRDLMK